MNVFLIISISTILVILILLLRYLIVSIEDLKAQIVAYKEQVIKGQGYTDYLLNDISKDVEYIRANINHKKRKLKLKIALRSPSNIIIPNHKYITKLS